MNGVKFMKSNQSGNIVLRRWRSLIDIFQQQYGFAV
jgi:hypothetical protein